VILNRLLGLVKPHRISNMLSVLLAKYFEQKLPQMTFDYSSLETNLFSASLVQYTPRMGSDDATAIAALNARSFAIKLTNGAF